MSRKKSTNTNEDTTLIPIIKPKTRGQDNYFKSIEDNTITFCSGPPGTGKTLLAIAKGVEHLRLQQIEKIVIIRPMIEAGNERIGFMPGTYQEKLSYYLTTANEELEKCCAGAELRHWKSSGKIEFCSIAFLRGRNLHNCFIIVEEASSCSYEQLLLILTRLGENSKLVISGDRKQSDAPRYLRSGFEEVMEKLRDIGKIGICKLGKEDIVRNGLIAEILERLIDD